MFRLTCAAPHVRTEVDAHMHAAASCIARAFNLIANDPCSRYITQYPRMNGDARERAKVTFLNFDRIIGDGCILAAKEDDPNIGRINNAVKPDRVRRSHKCDAVCPALAVTIDICICTVQVVNMVAGRVDRHVLDPPGRAGETQGRPAFGFLIENVMDDNTRCPVIRVRLIILGNIIRVHPAIHANVAGQTPGISRFWWLRHTTFPRQPGTPIVVATIRSLIGATSRAPAQPAPAVDIDVAEVDVVNCAGLAKSRTGPQPNDISL